MKPTVLLTKKATRTQGAWRRVRAAAKTLAPGDSSS